VWLQGVVAAGLAEFRAERPFIKHRIVWGAVRFEDRGCDESGGYLSVLDL
jgi:hypothetical protein